MTNKNILLLLICFTILVSLIPIVLPLDYWPIDCSISTGYCYMDSRDGTAILTNNPRIRNYVMVQPKGYLEPVMENDKTYLEKDGIKVLQGNNFIPVKKEVGDWDKWLYNFSNTVPSLTNGIYIFHTRFRWIGTTIETNEYIFMDIVDVEPPTIEQIELYEDGILSGDSIGEQNSNITVKIRARDDDGISDTEVVLANVSVDNGVVQPMVYEGNDMYSIQVALNLGQHTLRFYVYDTLRNANDSVTYVFDVMDTKGPEIYVEYPPYNLTAERITNLNFLTSEMARCKLYYYGQDYPIRGYESPFGFYHLFTDIILNDIMSGTEETTWFNISCEDSYANINYERIGITYSTRWPVIERIASSRGDYITSFYNGRITSLEVDTNINTDCRYVGGLSATIIPPIDYNSMSSMSEGAGAMTHSQDLTNELQLISDYALNKEYTYYAQCRDIAPPYRLSPLASTSFTLNIQFDITGKGPFGLIRYADVNMNVNTSWLAFCEYKSFTSGWTRFDDEQETPKYYHSAALGTLGDGMYYYDVRCTITDFADVSSTLYTNISFIVNTRPIPIPPRIWPLPSETEENILNVIGYTNQSGVTVHIGVAEFNMAPEKEYAEYVTYDSTLKGVFEVLDQSGEQLKVSEEAYNTIVAGDFVGFDGINLPYFRMYEVIGKQDTWFSGYLITLSPLLTQDIVGKNIFVYDNIYPAGWFNISVELIPEEDNWLLVQTEDLGLTSDIVYAGPVYFHINPPVFDNVPSVAGQSQITVYGHAKPLNNIIVYHYTPTQPIVEVLTQTNNNGNFSAAIDLASGENYVYAVVANQAGTPISLPSEQHTIVFDSEAPVFQDHSPIGENLVKDNVEIVVYALDNFGLNISSLVLRIDDNEVSASYQEEGSRLKIYYTTSFITREHLIEVYIKDLVGNVGSYSWTFTTYIPPQCADGWDNDNDMLIDYMVDPGCDSQSDDNESNPGKSPAMPECWDSADNDDDGLTDYMQDLDCDSIWDDSEYTIIVPECGDGIRNQITEDCDIYDLGGLDCSYFGYNSGTVSCDANCEFDTSSCYDIIEPGKSCGDGSKNRAEEECDGNDLGIVGCSNFDDYTGGILLCASTCEYDFTQCTGSTPTCGDGVINRIDELCDGADLRGVTCQDLGFVSGDLGCNDYCDGYDLRGCYSNPYCGDGAKNGWWEECDGIDLGDMVCEDFGFVGGSLSCRADCTLDKIGCGMAAVCGDNVINQMAEDCDGSDLDSKTCQTFGYLDGNLGCNANCDFDTSACTSPQSKICGNSIVEKPNDGNVFEECDGSNLDNKVCSEFDDYTGGILGCTSACEFDFSACTGLTEPYCGDDAVNRIVEDCDGIDLDGKTCQTFGYLDGNLGCNANCDFDTSACTSPQNKICGNAIVEKPNDGNVFEECDGSNLDNNVCSNFDDYNELGILSCTSDCEFDFSACIRSPPPVCGDNVINQMAEDCDGSDLRGLDCQYFGYNSGTVSCDANCEFDTSSCYDIIEPGKSCGDGSKNRAEEECDGNDLGIVGCSNFDDYTGGILLCASTCEYDFTQCTGSTPTCGDGVINRIDELCDGADLRGVTCQDLGYASGELACNSACDDYNVNGCYSAPICGDGVKNRAEEECDVYDLGGIDCLELGFGGGSLSCRADCTFNMVSCDPIPVYQCSDNMDNDGDNLKDYGFVVGYNDPGCDNLVDNDETDFTGPPNIIQFNINGIIVENGAYLKDIVNSVSWVYKTAVTVEKVSIDGVDRAGWSTQNNVSYSLGVALGSGAHKIAFTASNLVARTTQILSFTVDRVAPTVTIDSWNLIGTQYVNIAGRCGDDFGLASLELLVDGTTGDFPLQCVSGYYSANQVSLGQGRVHTIKVVATDLAGNSKSAEQIVDTGVPEITITEIIVGGISYSPENYVNITNKEAVVVKGTYIDNNVGDNGIYVLINDNRVFSGIEISDEYQYGANFRIGFNLLGNNGEEVVNNIAIVVEDVTELKDTWEAAITKDLKGPEIVGFVPETKATNTPNPTISIVTDEYASNCTINYTISLGLKKTEAFITMDHINFGVSLTNYNLLIGAQDLYITCIDSFSNKRTEIIPFVVDLTAPIIQYFDLIYPEGKIVWQADNTYKKYLIRNLNAESSTAAAVVLEVAASEEVRCGYYGSETGLFNNYQYSSGLMQSDEPEILPDNGYYTFNIVCEDKAGSKSDVKVIDVVVNSTHPIVAPSIVLDYPAWTGTVTTTTSPTFIGSIVSLTPDASITVSKLKIGGVTYELSLGSFGAFSQPVSLAGEGEYTFTILANNSKGISISMSGSIRVDTSGPGGCITVLGVTYCESDSMGVDVDTNCVDSDNGLKYYTKGNVVMPNGLVLSDRCVSNTLLEEKVCNSNTDYLQNTERFNCLNGCEEGACIS